MKKKKKGFTLVEMIAAVAIFAIVSVASISMISFCFKYNSINRQTYEADTNSKIFFECLKKTENRIVKPITPAIPIPASGSYVFAFDDASDVTNGIDAFIKNNMLVGSMTNAPTGGDLYIKDTNAINVITNTEVMFPNKKYALAFNIIWDSANEVFEFETWSWDIRKGEISMVNRKTFIGPKI